MLLSERWKVCYKWSVLSAAVMSELRYVGLQRSQEWYPWLVSPQTWVIVDIGGAVKCDRSCHYFGVKMHNRGVLVVYFYKRFVAECL
jgi:hypothetical protein